MSGFAITVLIAKPFDMPFAADTDSIKFGGFFRISQVKSAA